MSKIEREGVYMCVNSDGRHQIAVELESGRAGEIIVPRNKGTGPKGFAAGDSTHPDPVLEFGTRVRVTIEEVAEDG